jgi:hypothetical protein
MKIIICEHQLEINGLKFKYFLTDSLINSDPNKDFRQILWLNSQSVIVPGVIGGAFVGKRHRRLGRQVCNFVELG